MFLKYIDAEYLGANGVTAVMFLAGLSLVTPNALWGWLP